MSRERASELLRQAQDMHAAGDIDSALKASREALEESSDFVDAWSYLGTTLITRRLEFAEGLQALEKTLELAPDDPGVNYGLGWCYEFVAYRLQKQAQRPYRDPVSLYKLAAERLQRCVALDPEPGLKADAEDLLDAIDLRIGLE